LGCWGQNRVTSLYIMPVYCRAGSVLPGVVLEKGSDRTPPIAELELSPSEVANSNARLLHHGQEAFHLKRAPKPLYIHYPPDLCFTGMTELYGIWPAMKSACYKSSVQSSVRLATGQWKSWYYYLFIELRNGR